MRYFRVVLNPLDPFVLAGPGGDSILLYLPFRLRGQMLYATFKDGGYVRVEDSDMGEWGPPVDTCGSGPGPIAPYYYFQDSVLPEGVQESEIPLWTSQLQALVEPPAPMPQPTVWPVLNVVVQPG